MFRRNFLTTLLALPFAGFLIKKPNRSRLSVTLLAEKTAIFRPGRLLHAHSEGLEPLRTKTYIIKRKK